MSVQCPRLDKKCQFNIEIGRKKMCILMISCNNTVFERRLILYIYYYLKSRLFVYRDNLQALIFNLAELLLSVCMLNDS